jgi:alpha-beta hydrolase superfamily lysophospholipase
MTSPPTLLIQRPSLSLLTSEPWRAALEYASYLAKRKPPPAPSDGHPVVIFPGLGASGGSVAPLRKFCKSLGYAAFDWGRGFNTGPKGDLDLWLAELADHCTQMIEEHQQTVTLIGWSLGGIYAREVAKLMPGRVRQVITIGTPFNSDKDHTNAGWLYRLLSDDSPEFDAKLNLRLRSSPPVPTTSIFSRADGVVAWQTCLHPYKRREVQDVEIQGSHIGMGWNPLVMDVVADRLAQRPGAWKPYVGIG